MSNVNHPKHYNRGRIEVIEFLEDQFMNRPHEWNAVKYLARSGRKDGGKEIEDLEKAIWYIRRKIELLKAEKEGREVLRPNAMNPQPKERPKESAPVAHFECTDCIFKSFTKDDADEHFIEFGHVLVRSVLP